MIYDATTTIEAALAAWDSGDIIWSVEMGGLGPGYEQAIHLRREAKQGCAHDGDRGNERTSSSHRR